MYTGMENNCCNQCKCSKELVNIRVIQFELPDVLELLLVSSVILLYSGYLKLPFLEVFYFLSFASIALGANMVKRRVCYDCNKFYTINNSSKN